MASSIEYGHDERTAARDGALAGWWSRVAAVLVDALVLLVPVFCIGLLIGFAGGGSSEAGIAVGYGLLIVATIFYAPVMMARDGARNGQTIGKQVMSIRVVRIDGEPMALGRGMLREAIGKSLLGLVPLYSIVDVLFPLWDGRKQALHDKIASTTVRAA